METIRIMSNNLWWCTNNTPQWEAMGADCSNAARVPGFARMYAQIQPDLIGLQECSARMTHDLMGYLAENDFPYAMLWGRDTPILFRRDKFELVDSQVMIYPEEIPGLEGSFNNLKTKAFCAAVLRSKQTGNSILLASTHLWYKSDAACPGSEAARAWQMEKPIATLDAFQNTYRCPAVIVGDFNTWPSGAAVQTALAHGFIHAHDAATGHADDTTGMHYCCDKGYSDAFTQGGFAHSIDHILVRGIREGAIACYDRCCPDWYLPLSDHAPLWIDLQL